MKNITKLIITALFLPLLILISCDNKAKSDQIDESSSPNSDSLIVLTVATDSISILQLLLDNHQVDYKSSSMGAFVKAIDSIESSSGYYWLYSVNDSMIPIAADNYQAGEGDSVRWHFRKYNSK